MRKYYTWVIVILVVIFGGTFGFIQLKNTVLNKVFASRQLTRVISTQAVAKSEYHPTISAVGSLVAVNGINLTSQVNGQVTKVLFQSGDWVKEGQPLVQLDDSLDQQSLNNDQAQLNVAKLDYQRNAELLKSNAVSKSAVDSAKATYEQAQAAVKSDQVQISYKRIKAPFEGKIGIRQIDIGEYITPSNTIAPLQSLDPLYVDFSIPEQQIKYIHPGQKMDVTSGSVEGKKFSGQVESISSLVDVNTRTIDVRASISNPDHELLPGQFANVTLYRDDIQTVLTVPQTAIAYTLYGNSVFIATPLSSDSSTGQSNQDTSAGPIAKWLKGKMKKKQDASGDNAPATHLVTQQFVTLGETVGNNVIVTKGLESGQEVVTSGQLKIQSGQEVKINNAVSLS